MCRIFGWEVFVDLTPMNGMSAVLGQNAKRKGTSRPGGYHEEKNTAGSFFSDCCWAAIFQPYQFGRHIISP